VSARTWIGLLAVVNVALAALVGVLVWGPPLDAASPAVAPALVSAPPLPAAPTSGEPLESLRKSPVFYASRSVIVEEDPAAILATRPDVELVAVMLRPAGASIAFLRDRGGSATTRVARGEAIGGWQVVAIELARVTLERSGQTVVIERSGTAASNGLVRVAGGGTPTATPRGPKVLRGQGPAVQAANVSLPALTPRLYQPPPER
jgi:hypothetical protein